MYIFHFDIPHIKIYIPVRQAKYQQKMEYSNIKYSSTRGGGRSLNFIQACLAGTATDGGLYMPSQIPQFDEAQMEHLAKLSYQDLAFHIISPFIGTSIAEEELRDIINNSYDTNFHHSEIAPLRRISHNQHQEYVLELFHGQTLAFKDFALQFLGNLLGFILKKQGKSTTIIGATSGDTGSAAIYGCKDCPSIELFMLHPYNKVSEVQRLQMTSIAKENIHNIAIEGNFDDCQNMVKEMFSNPEFIQGRTGLTAVNSINFARIIAQIVYYFYAVFQMMRLKKYDGNLRSFLDEYQINFSVPTGNFGDIFAGFLAKKMGLRINKLIVATNSNDILHRFFTQNDYSRKSLVQTSSPSMDIQISSNFERYLYLLHNKDVAKIKQLMQDFKQHGKLKIEEALLEQANKDFLSSKATEDDVLELMRSIHKNDNYLIDPHTATGVSAFRKLSKYGENIINITLATASPAKFPTYVKKATGVVAPLPKHLADLYQRKEYFKLLPNDIEQVKKYILLKLNIT